MFHFDPILPCKRLSWATIFVCLILTPSFWELQPQSTSGTISPPIPGGMDMPPSRGQSDSSPLATVTGLGTSTWIQPRQRDSTLRLSLELLTKKTLFHRYYEAILRWAYWQPSCPPPPAPAPSSSWWGTVCEVGAEVLLPVNHSIWNSSVIVPLAHVGLPDSQCKCPWDALWCELTTKTKV